MDLFISTFEVLLFKHKWTKTELSLSERDELTAMGIFAWGFIIIISFFYF